jgi:acyl-CoA thioester hydrolase
MTRFKDTLPRGARVFESRTRVQWADVDAARIIYFPAYFRYAERSEMDMFRELGFPLGQFIENGLGLPRVHVEADYYAPALMDDWLRVRTHVEHVGSSSIRWKTVIFNERIAAVSAALALTVACIDYETKRARPLPDGLRSALAACLGEPS